MIVDPWGDIVAQCSDKEGYALCEIDLSYDLGVIEIDANRLLVDAVCGKFYGRRNRTSVDSVPG